MSPKKSSSGAKLLRLLIPASWHARAMGRIATLEEHSRRLGSLRGMALVLLAVMLFVAMDTTTKLLVAHYPVSVVMWLRFIVHVGLLCLVLLPRYGFAVIKTSRLRVHLLRGTLLIASSFFFATALRYLPLPEVSSITFISPILVTLLAVKLLDEKVELGRWIAIGCSFGAVLLIIRPGSAVFSWAALLPLLTATLFAVYQVMTRRLTGLETPVSLIFYPGLVGLMLYGLGFISEPQIPSVPWHLVLIIVGGILSVASHLTLIKAFQYAPASQLAPFTYAQLVWVVVAGYVVFGHLPDSLTLVGIAVLIASGVYCADRQRRAERAERARAD
jgi:drug/metabolite transporter (DMT)-like permease